MGRRKLVLMINWILVSVLVVGVIAGCSVAPGKSSPSNESGKVSAPGATTGLQPAAPAAPGAQRDATAQGAPSVAQSGQASTPNPSSATQSSSAFLLDRMIIRTANLTLIVKDVEGAIAAARDVTIASGGFVSQSSSRYDGENQVATLTVQVPATQFDSIIESLRRLAVKVEVENGSSQDVTEEYSDIDAQVRNLRVTEAGLQRLMDKATRMEDIIALQRELTNVRSEIERRQGRLQYLSRRSEMSTVTIILRPEGLAAKAPQPPIWQPLETARRAWESSAKVLLAVADVVIAVVVFLWWVIPLAAIALYFFRRSRVNRRAQHANP